MTSTCMLGCSVQKQNFSNRFAHPGFCSLWHPDLKNANQKILRRGEVLQFTGQSFTYYYTWKRPRNVNNASINWQLNFLLITERWIVIMSILCEYSCCNISYLPHNMTKYRDLIIALCSLKLINCIRYFCHHFHSPFKGFRMIRNLSTEWMFEEYHPTHHCSCASIQASTPLRK